MKVTFTEVAELPGERAFAAGKTYDLPPDKALRWLKRGAAVLAPEKTTTKVSPDKDA